MTPVSLPPPSSAPGVQSAPPVAPAAPSPATPLTPPQPLAPELSSAPGPTPSPWTAVDGYFTGVIDGVRVFWAPTPGADVSASLQFRVGMADETLPTHGISHLIEHLALFPLRSTSTQYNGMTGQITTEFVAAGSPDEVGAHLTSVANSLAALPFDRVDLESRVLRAEAAQRGPSAYGAALSLRYGPAAYGLYNHEELTLHTSRPDLIEWWRLTYFNRANAVLWITGQPPANLRLAALPDGHARPVQPAIPLPLQTPARIWLGASGVAMSMLTDRSVEASAAMRLLGEHLHGRLRDDLGLSYGVAANADVLAADLTHWIVAADCRREDTDAVLGHINAELARLRVYGFGDEAISGYQSEFERGQSSEHLGISEAVSAARNALLGAPPRRTDHTAREIMALTPGTVAHALAMAVASSLWIVPEGIRFADGRVHDVPVQGPLRFDGTRFVMTAAAVERRADGIDRTVHIAADGMTYEVAGSAVSVAWANVAAAKRWVDGWTLWGRDGFQFTLLLEEWEGANSIDATLRERISHELIVVSDERLFTPGA